MTQSTLTVLPPVPQRIADELGVGLGQVVATVGLLDDGATVPFIARYRKEVTGALDDAQLRTLAERLTYLRELEERRTAILESVDKQGKLDDVVRASIMSAETKARLEDVYLPFKPKRQTKAQIARDAGLEPLLDRLLADPKLNPLAAAAGFVAPDRGVADVPAALEGARAILVERFTEDADLLADLRERVWSRGSLVSAVREGKQAEGATFADWFDHRESLRSAPSHRVLALFRGEKQDVLDLSIDPEDVELTGPLSWIEARIAQAAGIVDAGRAADTWLLDGVRWAWRTRVALRIESDIRGRLREMAEDEAVRVFAANLRDLLLAAPAGTRATMGLDPGLRTGVKVAVVDATGKVVATDTVYPHPPSKKWDEALSRLASLAKAHGVELVAIGNGTGSRETDKLVGELTAAHPELSLTKAMVSEAGASVYSASAYASAELPELDVTLRGAVSIARRLQDPLAELVKIDPKSIGVGQYQHDMSEGRLATSLDGVVEDCVNAVGVDVNTASAPLLRRVSGVAEGLAAMIVEYRDTHGAFTARQQLLSVPRLGPKAYEQCAGFLRISGGDDVLDSSAVHPEAYPVVRRIAESAGVAVGELVGNTVVLQRLSPSDFVDERFGLPTVTDILTELDKPGRDPRPAFVTATFGEGVEKLSDLHRGMLLEGVVTNVAAFGAFVDIGVHQDGLVHISQLSSTFVKEPRDVVATGEVVKVRVLEVDLDRKRVSLTMLVEEPKAPAEESSGETARPGSEGGAERGSRGPRGPRGTRGPRGPRSGGRGVAPGEPGAGDKPQDGVRPDTSMDGTRPGRSQDGGGSGRPQLGARRGKPQGGKPRDGSPGAGKPRDSKPRDTKPRDEQPSEAAAGPRRGDRDRENRSRDRDRSRDDDRGRPAPDSAIADAFKRAGFDITKLR